MNAPSLHASGTFSFGPRTVHRLGFGAMRLTGRGVWGPPSDRPEALRVLRRAVELGVDFLDTANSYGPHVSEELIREALHPYPAHLMIATKAGLVRPGPDRWEPKGDPAHLRAECEGSLRRLGVECIDLFQLHRIDPKVPLADQLGVLADLAKEGKVRRIGLSEVTVEQLEAARAQLDVVSVQNLYNLGNRQSEAVLAYCEANGLAFIPWYPIGSGKLAAADGPLAEMAREKSATPAQLALAWLLARSPVLLPIPGTSSVKHLEENCGAAAVALDEADMARLEKLAKSPRDES